MDRQSLQLLTRNFHSNVKGFVISVKKMCTSAATEGYGGVEFYLCEDSLGENSQSPLTKDGIKRMVECVAGELENEIPGITVSVSQEIVTVEWSEINELSRQNRVKLPRGIWNIRIPEAGPGPSPSSGS